MRFLLLLAAIATCEMTAAQDAPNPRVTETVRLVRNILPAVVSIRVERATDKPNVIEHGHGGGSVIHADGYILTNNHVVAGAKKVEIAFLQKEWRQVKVVARLRSEDLALLKLDDDKPLPVLPLGRSNDLELGEPVITLGSPSGLPHTLSTGIISGLGRSTNTEHARLPSMVQTTAAISGGSSGGALINAAGQQVGVITSRKSSGENLGFAITVDRVREVFPQLINIEERFGIVHGIDVDPFYNGGAKVTAIADSSGEETMELQVGDVIHSVGDQTIQTSIDWHLAFLDKQPGDTVKMKIARGDQMLTTPLTLRAAPMLQPVDVEGLQPGLQVQHYIGQWKQLPDFSTLTPERTSISKKSPATDTEAEKDQFAEVYSGYLRIPADELYVFSLHSDDGSRLYLGERLVVDNDGMHPPHEAAGAVRLKKGDHPFRVEYFDAGGDQMLKVSVENVQGHRNELPADWLFHQP